jgi:long-chain fatty acid transport protein
MNGCVKRMVVVACLVLLPVAAWAQGAMLHGIGPVNSAMGGAGAALPNEPLGALTFNPALIAGAQGNQISFSTEFFQDAILIDTKVGSLVGRTTATPHLSVVPAFGWMMRDPNGKLAIGFGLIGLAGFGADYPTDPASILFSASPAGFGRIYTDYRATKIPAAFAYQVTPKLAIGGSINVYMGSFAVAPLPYKYFDVDPAGNRYYEEAGKLDNSWAIAAQVGFYYQATPKMSIGGSFTTPQNFAPYKWNSTNANPGSANFGQPTTVSFDLDGPMIATFGVGLKPSPKTQIAIDGMFSKYKGVHGFGGPGGVNNGVVDPFGWRSVWTVKAGIQHQVSDTMTVRAGYNYSQMPVRPEVVLSATGAPATFQHHFCAGGGIKMFPFLEMVASFYFVPRQHLVGPFPDLQNNVRGTLDESNKLTGGLIGMTFKF